MPPKSPPTTPVVTPKALPDDDPALGVRAVPASPCSVRRGDVALAVKTSNNSCPGPDGIPYAALHQAPRLVAWILGQAWHCAQAFPAAMDVVLGPNVDLLVWIPKKPNPRSPDMCRPLQLPSCIRRLFGAAVEAKEQRLGS